MGSQGIPHRTNTLGVDSHDRTHHMGSRVDPGGPRIALDVFYFPPIQQRALFAGPYKYIQSCKSYL